MKAPGTVDIPLGSRRGSAATDFVGVKPASSFVAAGKLQCTGLFTLSGATPIHSSDCDLQMTWAAGNRYYGGRCSNRSFARRLSSLGGAR